MAEIELVLNLAPPAQFQRGDSLTITASSMVELAAILDEASRGGSEEVSRFFLDRGVTVPSVTVTDVTDESKPPSDIEALAAIEKHLGSGQVEPASDAQVLVLVKRGMGEAEAKALSKTEASKRIKEGK